MLMTIDIASLSVPAFASVTVTVPTKVPTVLGVPLIKPPELIDRPDGNPLADQTFVPLPPVAVIW